MARARVMQRRQPNTRHDSLHSTGGGGREGLFLRSDEEKNPMSSSEASAASDGGPDKIIYNEEEMRRAISRIAHEIVERNAGAGDLVLIGLQTRGLPLAERLAARIADLEHITVPVGTINTRDYRDDRPERSERLSRPRPPLPCDVVGRVVVLVDDVLFTGRTARAALEALLDYGRPRKVQLAVLVDRGHRELPIRADYVGKNVPTAMTESISVRLRETDGIDAVLLRRQPE
jgi:pyrimidine operon attenuation protein/uracil phosphoribosyltransferase